MRDFAIEFDVAAPPARVWEVMSDGERWADWTPSVTSVEIYDKPLRVGSRALIRQPRIPPGKFKVTELTPGRSFTWATGIPGIIYAHARHSIEPTNAGSRVKLSLRFDGLLGGFMGRQQAPIINEYLVMEAAGLKRFSEDGGRDPKVPLAEWSAEAVRRLKKT